MSYDTNVYYTPEKYGLKILEYVDKAGSYEFDTFIIWEHDDGRIFYATDAGCSCPEPFEGLGIEDLTEASKSEAYAQLAEWQTHPYGWSS